ncbi:MAG: DUF924 family protein [Paenirhodobacter sp.]|uniref:DUF924 family protein n=1 Tax=Paenirhodobacter sp. TaxID=1965326 RepID=UPI003D14ED17
MERITAVIAFWRDVVGPERWFDTDPALDQMIRRRFEWLWRRAMSGSQDHWLQSPEGALALTLLLDQFPRRMFRGCRECWLSDERARTAASRAIELGFDLKIEGPMRQFFYMPFIHAEDLRAQELGLRLFEERMPEGAIHDARARHLVIRRFGRFPWRNDLAGRRSSDEEAAFLWAGGYDWALRAQGAAKRAA